MTHSFENFFQRCGGLNISIIFKASRFEIPIKSIQSLKYLLGNSFSNFLTSKSPEALPYKGLRFQKMKTGASNS